MRTFYFSTFINNAKSMLSIEDAAANAVGVLGVAAESRVESAATGVVFLYTANRHRQVGVMSNLMDVVKDEYPSLYCDLVPCLSNNAKFFLNNKFNPSPEMLIMPGLYLRDGVTPDLSHCRHTTETK